MGRRKSTTAAAAEPESAPKQLVRLPPDKLSGLIQDYPNHDGTVVYLNRSFPQIDRGLSGHKAKYIETLKAPYPADLVDYITKVHGGGEFIAYFNDRNKPYSRIAESVVTISTADHEPILNLVELIESPKNTQYIERLINQGKMTRDDEGRFRMAGTTGASTADSRAAFEFAKDVLNRQQPSNPGGQAAIQTAMDGMKKAFDFALENNKPSDVLGMLNVIVPLMKQQDSTSTILLPLLLKMMEQQSQQQSQQSQMQIAMLQAQQSKQNHAGGINETLGVIQKLTEQFGIQMPGKSEGGSHWVDKLIEAAPQLIATFVLARGGVPEILGGMQSLAGAAPRPATAAVPGTAGNPAAAQPTAPAPPGAEQTDQHQFAREIYAVGSRVVACLERGYPGHALAESLDTMYGRATYDKIAAFTAQGIKMALRSFPDLWGKLGPVEAQLDQFIEEFLHALDELPEVENQEAAVVQ